MEDDKEDQENELLALAGIFEDEETFLAHEDGSGGSFYASVQLPAECTVKLDRQMAQQARALGAKLTEVGEDAWVLPIISLPPIELNFQYPEEYPSQNPPHFTLSCKWLSVKQLNKLCEKLDEIWTSNVGDVVVYQWLEFLKDETLCCLDITSPVVLDTSDLPRTLRQRSQLEASAAAPNPDGDVGTSSGGASGRSSVPASVSLPSDVHDESDIRAVQDIACLMHLVPPIVVHDHKKRQHAFDTSHHTCGVCFDDKFGRDCLRFNECAHVYCKHCMGEHFSVKIREDDVKGLMCPQTDCETQAQAPQVKELVEPELYKRYDQALLELSLGEMTDIVFCPRTDCQSPVIREEEGNMGICPACRFAFCVLCKTTFHGVSPCKVTTEEYKRIRDDYESATDDERAILEQRYGKHKLHEVINNCNSEEWIRKHSRICPKCSRPIQKLDGCNKMTCMKCRCYFCWICLKVLSRSDPYGHYNSGPCANRLFQGIENDDDDDDEDEDEEVNVVNIENWWQFV